MLGWFLKQPNRFKACCVLTLTEELNLYFVIPPQKAHRQSFHKSFRIEGSNRFGAIALAQVTDSITH